MKRPVSVYLNSVKYAFFPGIVQISCYITSMFIRFVVTPQSIHPLSQITNPFQGLRVAYVIFNLVKLSRNERQRTNSSECWLRVSCLCVSSVFWRKISTSTETAWSCHSGQPGSQERRHLGIDRLWCSRLTASKHHSWLMANRLVASSHLRVTAIEIVNQSHSEISHFSNEFCGTWNCLQPRPMKQFSSKMACSISLMSTLPSRSSHNLFPMSKNFAL